MNIEKISLDEQAEIMKLSKGFMEKQNITSDENVLSSIRESVDRLRNISFSDEEVSDICFELGSAYGTLIQENVGWNWFKIRNENEFAYAICNSKLSYGIQVFHYFNLLLTTNKTNNSELLFNMILEIDDTKDTRDITFLV